MARLLAVMCSGRRRGRTAGVLEEAVASAREVAGVEVEVVCAHDYRFGPCTSCFWCIRHPVGACNLEDDMGMEGKGALFKKLKECHGLFIADSVHHWGPTAQCHLLIERMYPFTWSGEMEGLPFASVSVATNQGMQMEANRQICRWAFTYGMRYIGGIPIHCAHMEESLEEVRYLGRQLAEATLQAQQEGRRKWSWEERCAWYADSPWLVFPAYIENLTRGTYRWESSLPEQSLRHGTFRRPEALELLEKCSAELKECMRHYHMGNWEAANCHLTAAGTYWTHATWKEFLELQVVKAATPTAYRPLTDMEGSRGEE